MITRPVQAMVRPSVLVSTYGMEVIILMFVAIRNGVMTPEQAFAWIIMGQCVELEVRFVRDYATIHNHSIALMRATASTVSAIHLHQIVVLRLPLRP